MKPGATARPPRSITRAAGSVIAGAIRAIVSPRTARSARYQGLPAPSTMRALRSTRSYACASAAGARKTSAAPRKRAPAARFHVLMISSLDAHVPFPDQPTPFLDFLFQVGREFLGRARDHVQAHLRETRRKLGRAQDGPELFVQQGDRKSACRERV